MLINGANGRNKKQQVTEREKVLLPRFTREENSSCCKWSFIKIGWFEMEVKVNCRAWKARLKQSRLKNVLLGFCFLSLLLSAVLLDLIVECNTCGAAGDDLRPWWAERQEETDLVPPEGLWLNAGIFVYWRVKSSFPPVRGWWGSEKDRSCLWPSTGFFSPQK